MYLCRVKIWSLFSIVIVITTYGWDCTTLSLEAPKNKIIEALNRWVSAFISSESIIITIGVLLAKEFWTEIQDSRFTPLTINGWNLKTHPMNPRHGLDTLWGLTIWKKPPKQLIDPHKVWLKNFGWTGISSSESCGNLHPELFGSWLMVKKSTKNRWKPP